jgi:hypothetical protein
LNGGHGGSNPANRTRSVVMTKGEPARDKGVRIWIDRFKRFCAVSTIFNKRGFSSNQPITACF